MPAVMPFQVQAAGGVEVTEIEVEPLQTDFRDPNITDHGSWPGMGMYR
jgi:hypothetical protein